MDKGYNAPCRIPVPQLNERPSYTLIAFIIPLQIIFCRDTLEIPCQSGSRSDGQVVGPSF